MNEEIQESFDRIFAKQNGPFYDLNRLNGMPDIKAAFQQVITVCEDYIKELLAHYENPPKVYIAFIDNPLLGAAVGKEGDDYFIGFYNGSIINLQGLFGRMLCSPKVLTLLGDVSNEEAQKINNPYIINAQILIDTIYNYPEHERFPQDEDRRDGVILLTHLAMQFLALHELGHVVRGHLDYQLNKGRSTPHEDTSIHMLKPGGQSGLHSQGMEFDADYYATYNGMAFHSRSFQGIELPIDGQMRVMGLWVFAVCSLFRVFGLIPNDAVQLDNYSHPPIGMRMYMLLSNYANRLIEESEDFFGRKLSKEEISKYIQNCLLDVETGFREIGDDEETLKTGFNSYNFAAQHLSHSNKVMKAFNDIWHEIGLFMLKPVNS